MSLSMNPTSVSHSRIPTPPRSTAHSLPSRPLSQPHMPLQPAHAQIDLSRIGNFGHASTPANTIQPVQPDQAVSPRLIHGQGLSMPQVSDLVQPNLNPSILSQAPARTPVPVVQPSNPVLLVLEQCLTTRFMGSQCAALFKFLLHIHVRS